MAAKKAKQQAKKIATGAKKAGQGSLVMLIVGVFGTLFVLFLTLLGVRKGHMARNARKKRQARKKR